METELIANVAWIFATLLVGVIASLIIYARWNYGLLEKMGIPVIKPWLFLGSNYMEPWSIIKDVEISRQAKYGTIYGVYDGRSPQVYISDPKLIRQITVVDYDHFVNHGWNFGYDATSPFTKILDVLKDDQWKTVRKSLTPSFTSGKLRELRKFIYDLVEEFGESMNDLAKNNRIENVDIRENTAPIMVRLLLKFLYGVEIPNQKEENYIEFINKIREAFILEERPGWQSLIIKIFPFFLNYVPLILTSGTDFYISYISEVMKARTEQGGGDRVLLLDALIDLMKNAKTKTFAEMGVNEKVILAQAWEMFLACNASVQDFFPLVLFEICGSEEAQEKVYEEILAANSGDDRSGETQLNGVKYPYLNACISEVLRLHTTFSKPERRCNKNWSYGDIRIPKGVSVVFPSNALHRNPDLWPEPDKFIPERFLQPRDEKDQLDPFKWQAFGQGQRGCIGQRVAMDLLRTFSICLFKRFRVERSAGSEKLEWSRGGVFFVAYEPFYFNFIKRG